MDNSENQEDKDTSNEGDAFKEAEPLFQDLDSSVTTTSDIPAQGAKPLNPLLIKDNDNCPKSNQVASSPPTNLSILPNINMDRKSKRNTPRLWRDKISSKRKRPLNEEEDDSDYGAPYVVLALNQGNPITCYMMPKEGDPETKQYVAILPQPVASPPASSDDNSNSSSKSPRKPKVVKKNESHSNLPLTVEAEPKNNNKILSNIKQISPIKSNLLVPNLTSNDSNKSNVKDFHIELPSKPSPINQSTDVTTITSDIETNLNSFLLPPLKSDSNKIQITMIQPPTFTDGVSSAPQIITKSLTKVSSPFTSHGRVFPVRHVLPKSTDGLNGSNSEIQKILEEQVKSLKKELAKSREEINEEKRNSALVKSLREKLVHKRKQIKTMCTQRKRLIKRLDNCREELEKTRKALELVESQAILWNNSNMSDLGKLIFGLHSVKSKRPLDSKMAANRAPPEVKGFVISLYMTSPKAYQLVRDCFNGLPHPKTVSKWLHGDRVEDSKMQLPKHTELNDVTIEETFSRVLDNEVEMDQAGEMELGGSEVTITENLLETPEIVEDGSSAVYYILDEKGNVTGQLSGIPADLLLSGEALSLPQHEVIINE